MSHLGLGTLWRQKSRDECRPFLQQCWRRLTYTPDLIRNGQKKINKSCKSSCCRSLRSTVCPNINCTGPFIFFVSQNLVKKQYQKALVTLQIATKVTIFLSQNIVSIKRIVSRKFDILFFGIIQKLRLGQIFEYTTFSGGILFSHNTVNELFGSLPLGRA
jgi:hypothetical protein